MGLAVHEVALHERAEFAPRIADLERGVLYPLGLDWFEVDHGRDYFAFFDRLGELSYLCILDGERVVGVCAAVLRKVPAPGGRLRRAWYLGDLKVRPEHRGRRLTARLVTWALPRKYPLCPRGYAVSMDPGDGGENRVVALLGRLPWTPLRVATTLVFYSLDEARMRALRPVLEAARGPLSFLSLNGKKDLVLKSTGAPMPLLHVQFGAQAEPGHPEPLADHVHMFCAPGADPLVPRLQALGHFPSATATLLHHRMAGWDWRFVLTSDI